MKKKQASSLIYMIFFMSVLLLLCAFAVDATIIMTTRAKLQNATESIALSAASEFNAENNNQADIINKANNTLRLLKVDDLKPMTIEIKVNTERRQVLVEATLNSPTFFLSFLGVSRVKLEAKSLAISEELQITAMYTGINWVTSKTAYFSDIITQGLNLNDTAILPPLGNFRTASLNAAGMTIFDFLDTEGTPLSLGPGGFITIKLPAPIIDKKGNDLYIRELGAVEGYFVFAGLDVNPQNPYKDFQDPGDGIKWVNISCTGTPENEDAAGGIGAYRTSTEALGTQTKFYGSGNFDIGASCSDGFGGISMAKYIRIIDDNEESAFVQNSFEGTDRYYKAMLYGEASSVTAGADIDIVKVLNHVKLAPPKTFVE